MYYVKMNGLFKKKSSKNKCEDYVQSATIF